MGPALVGLDCHFVMSCYLVSVSTPGNFEDDFVSPSKIHDAVKGSMRQISPGSHIMTEDINIPTHAWKVTIGQVTYTPLQILLAPTLNNWCSQV